MSSELPNRPDEPADRPAAQALPPPLPGQAEAADWTPQDWRPPHRRRQRLKWPPAPTRSRSRPTARRQRRNPAGHGVADRVDHSHPQPRARLDTAGHLGRHPHQEQAAPRPHPGRNQLCADRPVGDRRNRRRRDGRTSDHRQDRRARTQWPGGPDHCVAGAGHRFADAGRSL
jgi:hypothetical protein